MASRWKQIKLPEDPDWIEWHKQKMTPNNGRVMLKVWYSGDCFMASKTSPLLERWVRELDSTNMEAAKVEADSWAEEY